MKPTVRTEALQEMEFSFGRALQRIPLTLMWGLAPQDRGSLSAVYEHTDAVLAPATDFTSPDAQLWLDHTCSRLEEWSQQPESPIVTGSVMCPMKLLKEIAQLRSLPFPMPAEVSARDLVGCIRPSERFCLQPWG